MPAGTYSMEDIDDYEEQAAAAEPIHLRSARVYILGMCKAHGIQAGILGGYSLMLRGSRRRTTDIDIYFAGSMNTLKAMVNQGDRVIRPASGLAADVYKIFVRTAGAWDDIGGEEQLVEIDMMPQGGLAGGTIETIHADHDEIPVIDIPCMIKNKLKSFDRRESQDDLYDIQWLIDHYPDIVAAQHDNTDYAQRERFIEALDELSASQHDKDRYKQALGVIWPPIEP